MNGWQDRLFPGGEMASVSPSYRPGGPADRWFGQPPESLEYVQLIGICRAHRLGEMFKRTGRSTRWRGIFDTSKLPNVRGFAPFDFEPDEVAEWPVELRARLEVVELQMENAYEKGQFMRLLELLPNLRRVKWVCGGLETADFAEVMEAVREHGTLESIYIQSDSCDVDDFRSLAKLSAQLKEFAWCSDSCTLTTPGDLAHAAGAGIDMRGYGGLNIAVSKMLPHTTVHIFSCYEELLDEGGLSRHFLPCLLEPWQREALGPLHNSKDPQVLELLIADQHVDAELNAHARAIRSLD
jgi:hypothetical protein